MPVWVILVTLAIALFAGPVVAAATSDATEDPPIALAKECSQQPHFCVSATGGWEMLAGTGR